MSLRTRISRLEKQALGQDSVYELIKVVESEAELDQIERDPRTFYLGFVKIMGETRCRIRYNVATSI